jgi:hypothetical protein
MGIDKKLEEAAKSVQESANSGIAGSKIRELIHLIINTCTSACRELEIVLINLNKSIL